jgi:hypothetical protein
VPEISDAEWIIDLAFFVDIVSLLDVLNTKFQRKGEVGFLPNVILEINLRK